MTPNPENPIAWGATTWKGSRRDQHLKFQALPFARKLEVVEQMTAFSAAMKKKSTSRQAGSNRRTNRN